MSKLLDRIAAGETLVADGAMGTMLFERGLKPGDCPEALNLEHPEVLGEIASAYLEAGADIIQTNTFGGSPLKLSAYGLDGRAEEINRRAVAAVRAAVGERALISGSCGPTGKILTPYGDTEPETISQAFKQQINALIDAGVDIICVETMIDLTEASLAIKAAREISGSVAVMATMTFDSTPRGFFTIMGVDIAQAAAGLAAAGADIVGSNCGNGIDNMVLIAGEFRANTQLPLIIQSNAGLPVMKGGRPTYPESPDLMAARIPQLLEAEVSVIGGCCGTTPDHIRAFRSAIQATQD